MQTSEMEQKISKKIFALSIIAFKLVAANSHYHKENY